MKTKYVLYSPSGAFHSVEYGTKKQLLKYGSALMYGRFGKGNYERNGRGRWIRKGLSGTPLLDLIIERVNEIRD